MKTDETYDPKYIKGSEVRSSGRAVRPRVHLVRRGIRHEGGHHVDRALHRGVEPPSRLP